MKLIALGERKKKHVLKEAIKEVKKIFFKLQEEELRLKEVLQKRVEENTAIMDAARRKTFGPMGALDTQMDGSQATQM